jgi:uncharacterized protein (TIGR02271 family)
MENTDYPRVTLSGGRTGYIVGPADDAEDRVLVQLDSGDEVSVPASALYRDADSSWTAKDSSPVPSADRAGEVIPVVAEELHVDKRTRVTGTVRVSKDVSERQESVSMPVARERADIRRIIIDQPIDAVPAIRREGDTIIFPVVEEVPVVRKQLVLKEEVHITRHRTTERREETYTLRQERPVVQRLDEDGNRIALETEPERKPATRSRGEALGPRPKTGIRKNKIIRPD